MNSKLATLYLFLVTLLWGLTFPLIELCVHNCDPVLFVATRFFLASLPILPFFIKNLSKEYLIAGAVLGLMNLGGFVFQTVGLETVNASRAAFLTGIYVLMIPFISPLLGMGKPRLHDVVSAAICSVGIFILTECSIGDFCMGDVWILIADVFIAVSIIYVAKYAKKDMHPSMLAFGQIIMTGLYAWVPALILTDLDFSGFYSPSFLISIAICSFLCTIVALFLQSKSQKYVSIQNAALIFSLEPVFAAIFDTLLTRTPPTLYTLGGGFVIVMSILYLELCKPKEEEVLEVEFD
jgi:drug/metabolite transporter (DMT)-like permease